MHLPAFENYLHRNGFVSDTIKTYVSLVLPFTIAYENLKDFTFKQVNQAMGESLKSHQSQQYKNTILCALKKYYDYLIESGQRNDHPCRTMRFKAIRKKGVIHNDLFTSSELELLLQREERYPVVKERNQVLVSLLIYQGLKVKEICDLKVTQVNLDEGKIYVKETKSTMRRHLELHPKQYRLFDKYMNQSRKELLKGTNESLVIGMRGGSITKDDIRYLVETFRGLFPDRQLSPDTIRMSVVSNWLNEKRFPLDQVQLMAGHRNISTTAKYRQSPTDDKRLIINRIHPLG